MVVAPQRLLGAFFVAEFQKNSVFSKFDRKILTFISDVFKNCRFGRQWLLELISICSKRAKQQNPSAIAGGVFVLYCLVD
ncbi:TPA: hypothetical protein VB874_002375 [Streptococcus suis]|nr:hypothetical protein [Streptococcus suis]